MLRFTLAGNAAFGTLTMGTTIAARRGAALVPVFGERMSTPTTAAILHAIFDRNVAAYEAQLLAFGKTMPKKTRETLLDGFKDGQAASVRALKDLGLFHVVEVEVKP
jgi:hypothetical protein